MKLNTLYEGTSIDYENVNQWIKDNCYTYEGFDIDDIELKRFSIGEIDGKVFISTTENFKIRTDTDILPYKLKACTEFTLEAPHLKNCSQFPEIFGWAEIDIALYKCHALDFSDFPTLYKKPIRLHINNINNISISKIFVNKNLYINKLYTLNCFDSTLHDCEQWDDINVNHLYFECQNKLKNFTHILNIPQNKLNIFRLKHRNGSYYDEGVIDDLNNVIRTYRDNQHNTNDYVMDMTLALIDLGLEDIV